MTKASIDKIEKQFMKDTILNIKNWAEDKYVGGGVEIDKDVAKVEEDFKHLEALNTATKALPSAKLTHLQKSLTFDSTFGYHNAASAVLDKAVAELTALTE